MKNIKIKNCTFRYNETLDINGKSVVCNTETADEAAEEIKSLYNNIRKEHNKQLNKGILLYISAFAIPITASLIIGAINYQKTIGTVFSVVALLLIPIAIFFAIKYSGKIDIATKSKEDKVRIFDAHVKTVKIIKKLKESESKIKSFFIATDENKKPMLLIEWDKYSSPVPDALNFVHEFKFDIDKSFKNQEITIDCVNEEIITD